MGCASTNTHAWDYTLRGPILDVVTTACGRVHKVAFPVSKCTVCSSLSLPDTSVFDRGNTDAMGHGGWRDEHRDALELTALAGGFCPATPYNMRMLYEVGMLDGFVLSRQRGVTAFGYIRSFNAPPYGIHARGRKIDEDSFDAVIDRFCALTHILETPVGELRVAGTQGPCMEHNRVRCKNTPSRKIARCKLTSTSMCNCRASTSRPLTVLRRITYWRVQRGLRMLLTWRRTGGRIISIRTPSSFMIYLGLHAELPCATFTTASDLTARCMQLPIPWFVMQQRRGVCGYQYNAICVASHTGCTLW